MPSLSGARNKGITVYRFLVLLALIVGLHSCAQPIPPKVQGMDGVKVNRNNEERRLQFDLGLKVNNPNNFRVALLDWDLDLFLNGWSLGKMSGSDKQVLHRNTTETLRFGLRTDLKKLAGGLAGILTGLITGGGEVDIRVSGRVTVRARCIRKRISMDHSTRVPIEL